MAFNRTVGGMAGLRILSSLIEAAAALTMFYYNDIRIALGINAVLGLVGPVILIGVTATGLYSLADELSAGRILLVLAGVFLIILGTR